MATVRGLTAERMLEIEAASVVDGDIVGENLILKRQDGSTIDAGPVRGVQGPTGPAGLDLSALPTATVLEVGMAGQIRAGRRLTVEDFTVLCGLPSIPIGLFNLGSVENIGTGPDLVNKGGVGFGPGITGAAAEAAVLNGQSTQGFYVADSGGGDPFRIKYGSFGGWFRTNRRGTTQRLISKWSSTDRGYALAMVGDTFQAECRPLGSASDVIVSTTLDVGDAKWHFCVVTWDGSVLRVYVDGVLEGEAITSLSAPLNALTVPFNVGSRGADAATASTEPVYGAVDEVFITPDVLSPEQVKLLYCASIDHGFTEIPKHVVLNVRRRRRGAQLVSGDFPAAPARLYNLVTLNDAGSNNVPLVANQNTGNIETAAGPDGSPGTARYYNGAHLGDSGTDAGLPAGVTSRSYGCWYKAIAGGGTLMGWGTMGTGDARIYLGSSPRTIAAINGGDQMVALTETAQDGRWHFVVVTEDNNPADGTKRKLYFDGRLVSASTGLANIVLAGANRFRIGANPDGTNPHSGHVARAFVYAGVLTPAQIFALYLKSGQAVALSPKNPGDHVEAFDAANLYVAFDGIESQDQIDLAVAT